MIGELVGPYLVRAKLGSGGMGDVYLAEDTRLGRRVALKRPSAAWLSIPEQRVRLHREASAAARLNHPNIAGVYDILDAGTHPYIVMEYVEGENLSDVLQRTGPLPVERAVQFGIQLADALAAAHAGGVVHRDLKPGNVAVTPEGGVKILDFGLAVAKVPVEGGYTDAERLTAPGQFIGTAGYSSPEQLAGMQPGPGDDIYALGVLLFQLLSGRLPFQEDNALHMAVATMTRTAPRLDELDTRIPSELSSVVAGALARDPRDRTQSAARVRDALQEIADGLAAGPTGERPAIVRGRKRSRIAVLLILAAVAIPGILTGVWLVNRGTDPGHTEIPVVAVLPFRTHSDRPADQAIASGMRDVLIANLGRQTGINVLSRAATAEPGGNRQDLRRWSRDLGATFLVDGSLQRAADELKVVVELIRGSSGVNEWTGTYAASANEVFPLQERVADGLRSAPPLVRSAAGAAAAAGTSGTQDVDALALYGQAVDFLERPDIPGNLQRGAKLLEAAVGRDRHFALAWARLGESYWGMYEVTSEKEWTGKATSAINEALRLDPYQPLVRISLARVYHGTGRSEVAIEELNKALSLQSNNDDAHRLLGQVLQEAGRPAEAAAEYRQAISLRPNYWRNYNVLGGLYYATGDYSKALDAFTRVTELQPDNARGFHNVGIVYYHLGNREKALEYYLKAIKVSPMAESHSAAGTIYYNEGRYEDAVRAFQQAIELSPNNGVLYGNLGDANMRLKRVTEARKAFSEAVRLDHSRLSVNPNEAAILARVAVHEAKLGRTADAERHASRAVELRNDDGEILYRAAVVRALRGDTNRALADLERALKHGYSVAIARNDHDLASLHDTAKFRELISVQ